MKRFLPILFLALLWIQSNAQNSAVGIGEVVPSFSAQNDLGMPWNSSEVKSDFIVIYFYPAAMTGGCTKQACAYRDNMQNFKDLSVTVVGVSGDYTKNLEYFKTSYDLNFTLLSDSSGNIASMFGVDTKSGGSIDREIRGETLELIRGVTTSRWTFILDRDRKIIYKNSEVNASEDSATVLQVIQKHSKG